MSLANPVGLVLSRLADAQPNGDGWKARCPAHDDRQPSLSIGEGDDGRALLNCFAGCSTESIVAAIGLTTADLFSRDSRTKHQFPTDKRKSSGKGRASIVATYDYRDADGTVLYQVCRMQPKDFRQRQPDGKGGWNWSTKGVRKVLYRLPELMAAGLTRAVAIVEGEKDADRLATLNIVATTNAGGAGKWLPEYNEFLRGRPVVLLPDNDDAGRRHADAVAIALHGIASSIRVVDLPGLPDKGDVSDWLDASGTCEQLAKLTKSTPYWTPPLSWPDLEPLGPPSLPPFPSHVLPTVLREWIEAEAEATQTPADLPGLLALAVCSAAIARKIEVAVRDSWREPVNLYVAVLLEPANRKSAVFSDATNPLRTAERESIEQNRSRIARESAQRRQAENRLRSLEKKAASKDDESVRNEAIAQAEALADWPEPVLPRLIVDDSTSEKLGIVLAEQDGRIASMSPEGGVFDLMAGLYSKSGMPQFGVYLMGHAGDDLRVDRVSRPTLFIRRPAITMALAIQPAVIEGLADKSAFRGRGLLARFLYAAPKSRIGERDSDPPAMPNDVRRDYDATVKRLIELEPPQPSDDSDIVGADLTLTVAAKLRLKEFLDEIEADLADCGRMETMRDWGGKLAGATIRLAAIFIVSRMQTWSRGQLRSIWRRWNQRSKLHAT